MAGLALLLAYATGNRLFPLLLIWAGTVTDSVRGRGVARVMSPHLQVALKYV